MNPAAVPAPGPQPRAICILGVHRSGTSVVARAVSLLGAWLGEPGELLPPAPDNPEGFWERTDILDVHSRLLAALKATWDTAAPLPEGWHRSEAVRPLRDELAALVRERFSARALWAWKDPRSNLLLPLWEEVLRECGIDLALVFTARNPLDVARSLWERDGIPLARGFGIWFNYNLAALRGVRGLPVVFLSYDAFVEDGAGELRRCADALGLPWPGDDRDLRAALASAVRPGLRHSVSGNGELVRAGGAGPVAELWGLLDRLVRGARLETSDVDEIVRRLSTEHAAYASFFREEQTRLWDTRAALRETEARCVAAEGRLIDAEGREQVLLGRLQWMEGSLSWRVTAPLRRLVELLRGR